MTLRSLLLSLSVATVLGCGRDRDPRCDLRPPPWANYGQCDSVLPHSAYFPELDACEAPSGCSCDAHCQANELPFRSVDECEAACVD